MNCLCVHVMRGARKFCQRVFKSAKVLFFFSFFCEGYEGREDTNTTKTDQHRPTSETPLKLNAGLVAFWLFQGIWTSMLRHPMCLYFFRGYGPFVPCWVRPRMLYLSRHSTDEIKSNLLKCFLAISYMGFLICAFCLWLLYLLSSFVHV